MKKISLLMFVLIIIPLASALEVNEPTSGYTYYNSLVDVNITWNKPLTGNCSYNINHQKYQSISCDPNFIMDVPYDSGATTFNFFEDGAVTSTTFTLNNSFTSDKGILIAIQVLLPFLLMAFLWFLAFKMKEEETEEGGPSELISAGKNAIRLFLIMFGFIFVWSGLNSLTLAVRSYIHNDHLLAVLNNLTYLYGWLFWIVLFYVAINVFISAIYLLGHSIRK